jgi:hypothetical protein
LFFSQIGSDAAGVMPLTEEDRNSQENPPLLTSETLRGLAVHRHAVMQAEQSSPRNRAKKMNKIRCLEF